MNTSATINTYNGNRIVDPALFYAAAVRKIGLGLFCKTDLNPGDIWWTHDLLNDRYIEGRYSWDEYSFFPDDHKKHLQRLCYVEPESRTLILCTQPFCFVNHGSPQRANSGSDKEKNSVVTANIPAGEEILISYDYDAIISLIWKFDEFKTCLPTYLLTDENFLFTAVSDSKLAIEFLSRLR